MSLKNHKLPISRDKDFLAFLQSLTSSVGVRKHGGYFACFGGVHTRESTSFVSSLISFTQPHRRPPPLFFSYFTLFLFFFLFFFFLK